MGWHHDLPPTDWRLQLRSGAGAAPGAIPALGSFEITPGADALTSWSAGDGFDKQFCATCGSRVIATDPGGAGLKSTAWPPSAQTRGIRPTARQFTNHAAVWKQISDDDQLEHFPANRMEGNQCLSPSAERLNLSTPHPSSRKTRTRTLLLHASGMQRESAIKWPLNKGDPLHARGMQREWLGNRVLFAALGLHAGGMQDRWGEGVAWAV
ncbi:MAG: hypothetical protein ACSLFF_07200 [Solirubrobacterales bacterium]